MDTMMIKTVCEMLAGEREETGFGRKKEVIDKAHRKLFDFDYPIFDEAYRPVLEKKILNHYYMREINADTIGQFQHYLEITLNEVMPYYNQLYQSELLEFNPIYDVDYTRTHTLERDETREGDTDEKTIRKDTTDRDTSQSHTSQTTLDSDVASNKKTLGQGSEETSGLHSTSGSEDHTRTGSEIGSGTENTDTTHSSQNKIDTVIEGSEVGSGSENTDTTHSSQGLSDTTTTDKTVNTSNQESTAETSAEENSDTQRNEWNLYLDTPQGDISTLFTPVQSGTGSGASGGTDGTQATGSGDHLTNARRIMGGETLERTNVGDSSSNVNTTQNVDVDGTNLTNTNESGSGSSDTTTSSNLTTNSTEGTIGTESGSGSSDTETTSNLTTNASEEVLHSESGTTSGSKDTTQDIQETGSVAEDATTNTTGSLSGTDDITFDSDRQMNRAELMSINNIQQYSEHVQGKMSGGTYSKMLTEFRNTFLNVDQMILKDLETCFYGLW